MAQRNGWNSSPYLDLLQHRYNWLSQHPPQKQKKQQNNNKKSRKRNLCFKLSTTRCVPSHPPQSIWDHVRITVFCIKGKKIKLRRTVILATCTMKLIGLVNDKIFTTHCFTGKANGLYYPLRGYSLGSPILNKMESIS